MQIASRLNYIYYSNLMNLLDEENLGINFFLKLRK